MGHTYGKTVVLVLVLGGFLLLRLESFPFPLSLGGDLSVSLLRCLGTAATLSSCSLLLQLLDAFLSGSGKRQEG